VDNIKDYFLVTRIIGNRGNFMSDVGPKSREVRRKQGAGDHSYTFNFLYAEGEQVTNKVAVVCTFKNTTYDPITASSIRMVMTIKEASLLALYTLSEIQQVIFEKVGNGIFTPLCGDVFKSTRANSSEY